MVVRTIAALLLLVGRPAVHPLHTTFTEISEDPSSHIVTVTVRSFTDDLARALGMTPPPSGTLSALPDSALARYVRTHFTLSAPGGRALVLRYTGQRQSADLTWIAFGLTLPEGLRGASLTNRMQSELFPDQVNLVQANYGGRTQTLLFNSRDDPKQLP